MHRIDIHPRAEGDAVVFDLAGEIDLSNVEWVREAVHAWIGEGYRHLILNLSGVRYMDSSGLALMIAAKRQLGAQGTVSLVGCAPAVRRMLSVTRLDTIFPAYDSEEAALRTGTDVSVQSPQRSCVPA